MTDEQRQQIIQLRKEGCGYTSIAKGLGISRDTVRSFCRRNGLAGEMAERTAGSEGQPEEGFCRECGTELRQRPGVKKKVFCCRECRIVAEGVDFSEENQQDRACGPRPAKA